MAEAGPKDGPQMDEGRTPHPVDLHVGGRVELRRKNLGMSRSALARAVHLTFQQIQKFERGTNRISASRLHDLAQALDVPVGFFFDDMPENLVGTQQAAARTHDPMALRETVELLRAYHQISDRNLRRGIYDVARALAASRRFGPSGRDLPPPSSNSEETNGTEPAG